MDISIRKISECDSYIRTSNGLCVWSNAELVNKNDKTNDRQDTDTRDDDVEDVSSLSVVRSVPEQQYQEHKFAR
jgi:hypothetical protein